MAEHFNLDPDNISRIIMLAFGQTDHDGTYWCYVAVKPSRYDDFAKNIAGKKYNLQNYVADGFGEIIVSGEGGLPPQEVSAQVAQIFGIPLKDLFAGGNPKAAITTKIEAL